MTDPNETHSFGPLDLQRGLCNEFERALVGGGSPSLADFLKRAGDLDPAALFRELLAIDLRERQARGEQPNKDNYIEEFPRFTAEVHYVFLGGTDHPADVKAAAANIILGVIAFHDELIDLVQLASVCRTWADDGGEMADILASQLTPSELKLVTRVADRKIERYDGAVNALRAVAVGEVRDALGKVEDANIRSALQSLGDSAAYILLSSIASSDRRSRYTLHEIHGKGGLGQVWLAKDTELQREVAFKELRPERVGDQMLWHRFLNEAKVTGQLEHPNIVPVYERGSTSENPFYTMKFVRGKDLRTTIRDHHATGSPEMRQLLESFVSICNAVGYAHSRQVLHRDLKPENVVLGDFGEVMVLDWGLAKQKGDVDAQHAIEFSAGSENLQTQGVVGTPAYMAPEQAQGVDAGVDERADVFGLGGILFQILTDRPPRKVDRGAAADVMVRAIATQPVAEARQVKSQVSRPLNAICKKALSHNPADRYASASAVGQEIQRYLADRPITVYRDPFLVSALRWSRHNRTKVVALIVACLVTIVLCGVGSTLYLNWEKNKRIELAEGARRLRVSSGWLSATRKEGLSSSLPMFAAAAQSESRETNSLDRIRIGTTLRQCATLQQCVLHQGAISLVELSPDGSKLLTAGRDGAARVWNAQTGEPTTEPLVHERIINHAAFSPNGDWVATAGEDGSAAIWDTSTGKLVGGMRLAHDDPVYFVAFDPRGELLVTASGSKMSPYQAKSQTIMMPDGKGGFREKQFMAGIEARRGHIHFWNAATGREAGEPLEMEGCVHHLAISKSGNYLAASTTFPGATPMPSRTQLWEVSTRTTVGEPILHKVSEARAWFAPDERHVVSIGSNTDTVSGSTSMIGQIRALESGETRELPSLHTNLVIGLKFINDGEQFVTASWDATLRFWNFADGTQASPPIQATDRILDFDVSDDGRVAATASRDGLVQLWDVPRGTPLTSPLLHADAAMSVDLSADGRIVATGSSDTGARVWTVPPQPQSLPHEAAVHSVRFSDDGSNMVVMTGAKLFQHLVSGSSSDVMNVIRPLRVDVWNYPDLQPFVSFDARDGFGEITSVDVNRLLFVTRADMADASDRVAIHRLASGKPESVEIASEGDTPAAVIIPQRNQIAVGGATEIQLWSTGSPRLIDSVVIGARTAKLWMQPDSGRLINVLDRKSGSNEYVVQLRDLRDGGKVLTSWTSNTMTSVRFRRDETMFVSWSRTRQPEIRGSKSGQTLATLSHGGVVNFVDFSPDGQRLVTCGRDGTARIWNPVSGHSELPPLRHSGSLNHAAFGPHQRLIATASDDGTARLWDSATGEAISPPLVHGAAVRFVAFHPNGGILATGGDDGEVRLWDITPDSRALPVLRVLAEVQAARRIDDNGGLVPLTAEELHERVNRLDRNAPARGSR